LFQIGHPAITQRLPDAFHNLRFANRPIRADLGCIPRQQVGDGYAATVMPLVDARPVVAVNSTPAAHCCASAFVGKVFDLRRPFRAI